MTVLDFVAARTVAMARLLEQAVHDSGPWSIAFAGKREDAVKILTPSRIVFLARLEGFCVLDPNAVMELWLRDTLVSVRPSPFEDDGNGIAVVNDGFDVRWEFVLKEIREQVPS
jgi:hypothetical protein